ncbi:hypothetical protein [Neorhizobium galegae]|uniref:hypothetical protein n=1 Tax=Neorhizobium galegae TaxID=399 RepID=UPI0020C8098E|nr:hypothetical protein [Neorhizobium galegae]
MSLHIPQKRRTALISLCGVSKPAHADVIDHDKVQGFPDSTSDYLKTFQPYRRFRRDDVFTTIGPDGRGVYSHRITPEGWLEIGRPGTKPCLIRPAGRTGFDAGALVACPGRSPARISVTDHPGVLTVVTGAVSEVFRYDPDTGGLISPVDVPAPSPPVFMPKPGAAPGQVPRNFSTFPGTN